MSTKTKWTVGLGAGLGAVALVLAVVWWGMEPERAVRLPDGRELRIKAVTFGTNHAVADGKALSRALSRFLPKQWEARLGVYRATHRSDTPCMMVWGEWSHVSGTNPPVDWASVFDDDARESEPVHWKAALHPKNRPIYGWEFSNFPRRRGEIGFRVYERDNAYVAHDVAELRVRNPAPGDYPVWTPSVLPLARTDGGLTVSLVSFETREDLRASREFWGRIAPWTAARFEAVEAGRGSDDWAVDIMEMTDATGNRSVLSATHYSTLSGGLGFVFNSVVWRGEAAVRLRVGLKRRAGFGEEAEWTLRPVAVPPVGGSTVLATAAVVGGMSVLVEELSRPPRGGAGGRAGGGGRVELKAQLIGAESGQHLSLWRVRDETGRELIREPELVLPAGRYQFGIELGGQSRALELTFVVHRNRVVEFESVPAP